MFIECSNVLDLIGQGIVLASQATLEHFWRIVSLQDYSTRVVLLGTMLLGAASGVLGVFLLLRKRVLIGDAIAHATLPGVVVAYLILTAVGLEKSKLWLLVGAACSGGLGGLCVLVLRHAAKVREDAALGTVLSVFFGAGVALLTISNQVQGQAAGLENFIYGKVAMMTMDDVSLIAIIGGGVVAICFLLQKEFALLCFDSSLARTQGWPVLSLDSLLVVLVVAVTIVGLQAAGVILMIALLVIPAASARFWTNRLGETLLISGIAGALSGMAGTLASAVFADLPSGAMIVLSAVSVFCVSFCFGIKRGVIWKLLRQHTMRVQQEAEHVLRSIFEVLESQELVKEYLEGLQRGELTSSEPVALDAICLARGWSPSKAHRAVSRTARRGFLVEGRDGVRLTPQGMVASIKLVREHRLLERYMIDEAEAQASQADRLADLLEHDLQPEHIIQLTKDVELMSVPPSPHRIEIEGVGNRQTNVNESLGKPPSDDRKPQ